jgi:3-dehydroquinate synthase
MQRIAPFLLFIKKGSHMKEIKVQVQVKPAAYQLLIGHDLFTELAEQLRKSPLATRYAVITDSVVGPLWAGALLSALENEGLAAEKFVFPAGEAYKTRETKELLENQLLERGFGRDTAVLALGGGVVGDVAGYVAATYMRGVPVIQIPTTTLAMADSSIGGKTGVDTPYGKNLIGAFHHPAQVYMDMKTLTTLDERNYRAGLAELVKHGFIKDLSILDFVQAHKELILKRDAAVLEQLFEKNCAVKNDVVSRDDQEKGLRQILNYGHTMGHAVEVGSKFDLIHGECVAIGMVFAARLACQKGICSREWAIRQRTILEELGLPVDLPAALEAEEVLRLMRMDKKVRQGQIQFVLPTQPGEVIFGAAVSEKEIIEAMKGDRL